MCVCVCGVKLREGEREAGWENSFLSSMDGTRRGGHSCFERVKKQKHTTQGRKERKGKGKEERQRRKQLGLWIRVGNAGLNPSFCVRMCVFLCASLCLLVLHCPSRPAAPRPPNGWVCSSLGPTGGSGQCCAYPFSPSFPSRSMRGG